VTGSPCAAQDERTECVFCAIAAGSIPAAVVWEDDNHIAFLSNEPNTLGFTVVIPRRHHPSYVFEAPESVMVGLLRASRTVAGILDDFFDDVGRTGVIFEGMMTDHLHAKLFPMHGTSALAERWRPAVSSPEDRRYFERYEGFIASNLGPRADQQDLVDLAAALRARSEHAG
jgi:histidine triad (HIT) family protein